MKRFSLLLFALLLCSLPARAKEVQNHGVVFEKWIRDTFFDGYEPDSYTQKWDIPKAANKKYGGVPVNPKAIKYKAPVDLGDALRQYKIDEPFMMIIGYWQQNGDKKRYVNIVAATITPENWKKLWGPVTFADLEKLDAVIKNTPDYKEARRLAQEMKKQEPFSKSILTLNPKIDSKSQRRLQCSLSFSNVFQYLAPTSDPAIQEHPKLFGVEAPAEFESAPRSFEKDEDEKK